MLRRLLSPATSATQRRFFSKPGSSAPDLASFARRRAARRLERGHGGATFERTASGALKKRVPEKALKTSSFYFDASSFEDPMAELCAALDVKEQKEESRKAAARQVRQVQQQVQQVQQVRREETHPPDSFEHKVTAQHDAQRANAAEGDGEGDGEEDGEGDVEGDVGGEEEDGESATAANKAENAAPIAPDPDECAVDGIDQDIEEKRGGEEARGEVSGVEARGGGEARGGESGEPSSNLSNSSGESNSSRESGASEDREDREDSGKDDGEGVGLRALMEAEVP